VAFPAPFYRWRPHPWHGIDIGPKAPEVVTAYIEITPFDSIKYEIDKANGYIRVDRPQSGSAQPPTLYGFVPRTYCAARVAALGKPAAQRGDGDPLDICVVSERAITRADILLSARVVGGLQMIDNGEADDKIVAVLDNDLFFSSIQELTDFPPSFVARLVHYFATYKLVPGSKGVNPSIAPYDRAHALQVINASIEDYKEQFEG
jgi:inorganic pyrophosphatase